MISNPFTYKNMGKQVKVTKQKLPSDSDSKGCLMYRDPVQHLGKEDPLEKYNSNPPRIPA